MRVAELLIIMAVGAKVWIEIGKEYKFRHDVLVVPRDCPHEVLLGNDLEFFDDLYRIAHTDTHNPSSKGYYKSWS